MSVPLYVPVLPARRHAATAYRYLKPDVSRRTAPLWTLHPHPGTRPEPLAAAVGTELRHVTSAQRALHAWLDAPNADADEAAVLARTLSPEWWEYRNLRPVTGPGRPAAQQRLAIEVARTLETGLGIRVPLAADWHDGTTADVAAVLGRLPGGSHADLFLDLGTVPPERTDAGKEALRALDSLVPLAEWRTIAVVAGGFPETHGPLRRGVRLGRPRPDWGTWRGIRQSGRSYLPLLRYGDYGVHPASYVRRPASRQKVAIGLLRYTTASSYHLVPVRCGRMYDRESRAAARSLTSLPDFRRRDGGAGERWLRGRAAGEETVGNVETWDRNGLVQHMDFAVHHLSCDPAPGS